MTYLIPGAYTYYHHYLNDFSSVKRCDAFVNKLYQDYKLTTYSIEDYNLNEPHYLDTSYYCNSYTGELFNTYDEVNRLYYNLHYNSILQYILLYTVMLGLFAYSSITYFIECESNSTTTKLVLNRDDSSEDTSSEDTSSKDAISEDTISEDDNSENDNSEDDNSEDDSSEDDSLENDSSKDAISEDTISEDGSVDSSNSSVSNSTEEIDRFMFEYYPLTVLLRQFAINYQKEIFLYLDTQNGLMEIINHFIFNQNSKFSDDHNTLISTKESYQNIKICFEEIYFNNDTTRYNYIPISDVLINRKRTLYTNYGHLNFIHWIYYSGIYQYVLANKNEIIDLMLKEEYINEEKAKKYKDFNYLNLEFRKKTNL